MSPTTILEASWISPHVLKVAVPTPTLPPSFETNTYVIRSQSQAILVDAGSAEPEVLEALQATLVDHGITIIQTLIATHYHRDHTQGLPVLADAYGADIHISSSDRPFAEREMRRSYGVRNLQNDYDLDGLSVCIDALPGHTHGHVHIRIPEDSVILVGDHMAGDGSVWIGPPDGHMSSYFIALESIAKTGYDIVGPGHGSILKNAAASATALLHRRKQRETELVQLIESGVTSLPELVHTLYGGTVPQAALWVAEKTVQAHLQHLLDQNKIHRLFQSGQFMYAKSM